ncbi:MATE family efflux transporter [Oceanobacillus salinisoli]|uniref:MATE family efflux transporter n=1 Tax=Oceanobacillus salinisoli TaxID=2678611 RepID=UPI0012E1AD2A|nr:MATE family efflux transporter [Oceanobacillus salinisoli]
METNRTTTFKALFIPILVEQLFILLLQNMDILMLSQYSDESVAAVGLANQLIIVATMVYGFINIGTTIQLTQLSGANNKEQSGKIICQSIYLNLLFTMILTIGMSFFSGNLLTLIQTPSGLMIESTTYLTIIAIGFFFQSIMGVFSSIFKSFSMVKIVMNVTVLTNIINIILNYLVLFTPFSLIGEGVFGVAIATNISRLIGAILMVAYFIFHKKGLVGVLNWKKIELGVMKKILVLGIPSAGEHVSYNLSQLVITGFIASLGAAAVTSKIYAQTTTSIVFTCSMAISQASQILIGKLIGGEEKDKAYYFSLLTLKNGIFLSTAFTVLIALLSFGIVPFFTSNEDIIKLTIQLVFLSVFWESARTANVILVSALNVAGDVKYPVLISVLVMWVFVIPLSFVIGVWLGYGLVGIWIVFILDEWLRAFLLYIRWKKGNWRKISVIDVKAYS